MSDSEIDRFAADLEAKAELREAARKHFESPLAQAAAFAQARGYNFTLEQLRERVQAAGKAGSLALGDQELDRVVGGACISVVSTSQALSNAAHNATNNQQQSYVTMQASTTQGVSTGLSPDTDTGASAVGIIPILKKL